MRPDKSSRIMPLLLSLSVVAGILIGTFYTNHFSGNRLNIINTGTNKINDLLQIIDNQYVDTVDMAGMVEKAMPVLLSELDPHSAYISAKDAKASVEDLKGSFSGIGVTFTIQRDTINIINVIKGGPSEKVGLLAGDRIVEIDGETYVGKDISNDGAMKKLKGEKGTKVKLGVKRAGEKDLLPFVVTRGDIPLHTVEASYMLTPEIGYIKVSKFGETTYPELLVALAKLGQSRFRQLVIDLRGNEGGYMHSAIQMVNTFLPKNRLIVYTEGRKSPREDYYSDGQGTFQQIPLVVLVDEGSASASEIFAGAIQDNDRGTIIGRRSFGKGLVQQPIEFRDGSIVRLTIARYHTPSGRCIQKPYEKGKNDAYEHDLLERFNRGEFFSADSIHQDGEAYKTSIGRTVYAGGGIMPDIFIPDDTSNVTSYYREAVLGGYIYQFAFDFTDANRATLTGKSLKEVIDYLDKSYILEKFANFAQTKGLKRRNLMLYRSRELFERNIYAAIINNILEVNDFYEFVNSRDPAVLRAIEVLQKGEAFPRKPKVDGNGSDGEKNGKEA